MSKIITSRNLSSSFFCISCLSAYLLICLSAFQRNLSPNTISKVISLYHFITLSLYHFITLSLYHFITLSLYHFITLSLYRNLFPPSLSTPDMATWQHGNMATWQHGNMATWQHGNMATWQHGNMATWQHGNMATWQHGNMATWQLNFKQKINKLLFHCKSIIYE